MECCRILRIWVLRAVGALCPGAWCAFAVMLLTGASAAHGQVIEEGGFPVKGGSISGESFSLSCPPRLVARAGESVLFSCSAAVVPEEGIRYEWESLSGDGLHLLSSANERSPLFTAPVSGESAEYVYRLTAMSVGVYETATVTVSVGGFVEEGQEAFEAPGEECGLFGGFGRDQEGCLPWEKAPSPDSFGDSPEDEGIVPWPSFPGSPGAEGKEFAGSSGARPDLRTPPYLDCPLAVFLEELETGSIECHVSDASGEEHLEYVWEPVGSTTRDYLDNPRLIPEDAPNPLVVVPEAPVYETLESFHVGETTFRYRYRLTATSRATGLSSWQEVEVFVSSSRPSVYCPLEVVVEEGATIGLDCEGVDPLSHRMDYDEEGASILWEWEGLWGTSTEPLAATDLSSALFTAPPGSAGKAYHYIASMTSSASGAPRTARRRVSVTVAGAEEKALIGAVAELGMNAPARDGSASDLQLICEGGTYRHLADLYFYGVVETEPDFVLDCEATGGPSGVDPVYAWSAVNPQSLALLSDPNIRNPTFTVIDVGRYWQTQYTLRVEASDGTITVTAEFIVIVAVVDRGRVFYSYVDKITRDEGAPDFTMDIVAVGDTTGLDRSYSWSGSEEALNLLSATDILTPEFYVPEDVNGKQSYVYTVDVYTGDADTERFNITVEVRDTYVAAPSVTCNNSYVFEGSDDIMLDCLVTDEPSGARYSWEARGGTTDTDLLISGTDGSSPTFAVPDEVEDDETYEYLLTVSAANAEDGTAEVTVTVLNRSAFALVCTSSYEVYEGAEDFSFDCEASGAPAGVEYTYVWEARGGTTDTDLLISGADGPSPTFAVPDEVDETTKYGYLLTVSAENAEDATVEVTVTVLNRGALALVCTQMYEAYEGAQDFAFDCAASGAPAGSVYAYAWTARGSTSDTSLLGSVDIASPVFFVPDEVAEEETYEYLLTVSATNAEDAAAEVTVTVLNKGDLSVVCTDPDAVYEGAEDFAFDCAASGAPAGSVYAYAWTARGSTSDTSLLGSVDIASPVFFVPDEVAGDETYEYLLTVSATNAEDAAAEVTVTVLNKGDLSVVCTDPDAVYEGAEDFALDCAASGAPAGSVYAYAWTARGSTSDTSLLGSVDIASPVFFVPDEVAEDETYEYLLTVSAENADAATVEVEVTVLDRAPEPVAEPVSPPVAESAPPAPSEPSALGVTASASSLRFGVQSADTQVSLDPMTDGISTRVSGPYHGGRMTLSLDGSEPLDENGEMDLSIELASPVVLRREGGIEDASIVLSPQWSLAESCEQLSSQAIGGLYTEVTLSEDACRLLRFGGELDLTGVPSGRYAGSMDIILRSGESEETHTVAVDVTVIPAQQVITIGPGGVRFSTSRELPAGLTEEQNLSIYPDVAFLTEEKPHGVFELSNPSLIPLEVTVSARFGYTEAAEAGREVVVEDTSRSHLGDLSQVVDIHPGVLVLMPGEEGLVRYGVKGGALATMAEKGYAAFFDVVSEPRQYVRTDRMPEEVVGDRTARVTMRVPGVYVPGEGASQLRATLLSISFVGPISATFLLETADHPFAGEVVAYDGDGRELGRRETLVYTRSRVRIPLDRMPEEGTVFLRFAPRGSGRVPEPTSIEWDAPRRDIGEDGSFSSG